jgi:hypothetical protein
LKHGLRAEKYMVLLDEDWGEFAKLEAALVAELAPESALQSVLARRVARAAWPLIRADRLEAEVFAERSYAAASPGLALIRDGNGTRSIETLLRYRASAMVELLRSLRTLKALEAEQAALGATAAAPARAQARNSAPNGAAPRREISHRPEPNEPEPKQPEPCPKPNQPERRLEYVQPEPPEPGHTLHEPAAPRTPKESEPTPAVPSAPTPRDLAPNEPDSRSRNHVFCNNLWWYIRLIISTTKCKVIGRIPVKIVN